MNAYGSDPTGVARRGTVRGSSSSVKTSAKVLTLRTKELGSAAAQVSRAHKSGGVQCACCTRGAPG
eukprot:4130225-Pleurochrysis_carterae.AAC.1